MVAPSTQVRKRRGGREAKLSAVLGGVQLRCGFDVSGKKLSRCLIVRTWSTGERSGVESDIWEGFKA